MRGFREKFPELISPNPGGPQDPLGESILNHQQPWLRVFEPRDTRIVIGRNQDPNRELLLEAVRADSIPIHRRVSGGGTVVLAPGSLVVALRLRQQQLPVDACYQLINRALSAAVQECGVSDVACYGHGDLAVQTAEGSILKILGASLRQTKTALYYLGVFLIDDLVPLMQRYLPPPSREPDYRGGREHAAFCTHLAAHGVLLNILQAALEAHVQQQLGAQALLD